MPKGNPNYPSTTGNPSGGGRGNAPKGRQYKYIVKFFKKGNMNTYEFCEIVNPPHYWSEGGGLSSNERVFVVLGTTKMGTANLLKDEKGKNRYFGHYIDAFNFLSKQGWHLSKMFTLKVDEENWIHSVMTREIKIDD